MAAHSSVPAWRIPGMGEPGGLPSMGPHRVRHGCSDLAAAEAAYMLNLNKKEEVEVNLFTNRNILILKYWLAFLLFAWLCLITARVRGGGESQE